MKVLIIYHSGLSKEALGFYDEYVRQGVQLDVIVPFKIAIEKKYEPSGYLTYDQSYAKKPYTIIPVDLRKPQSYGEGFKLFQLHDAIAMAKPDIIHVFDEYTSFYLAQTVFCRNVLYGRKVPVLCYASQNIEFKNPPLVWEASPRFFKRIAYKILFPLMLDFHKKYLDGATGCNSQALSIMKDLGATFPMKRTFWGINFDLFHPEDKFHCREKFGIKKDVKLIGYVGRLDNEKGVDTLLEALVKMDGYYAMISSEGKDKDSIDTLINSLGLQEKVYRYPNVSRTDLVILYNCFDVLVVPSKTTSFWKEQYGRVLVEAMGCHLAIVGSSSGAIPEVLEGYPKHLIFKEADAGDLVDKIKKAEHLTIPDTFNVDQYLERFSVTTFIKSYIDFYKEILHGKK